MKIAVGVGSRLTATSPSFSLAMLELLVRRPGRPPLFQRLGLSALQLDNMAIYSKLPSLTLWRELTILSVLMSQKVCLAMKLCEAQCLWMLAVDLADQLTMSSAAVIV